MASRIFNSRQSLEKEVKELFAKMDFGTPSAPTASFATTTPVVMTKSTIGTVANVGTVTLQVEAPAANPTDTVLADITGTAAAIVITITPNDGTNNGATPVPLTTAELAELLDTGSVVGKTVTITDTGSLLANIAAATGGDATDLADAGEGDGEVATWAGAVDNLTDSSVAGISSMARNDVGDYSIVLEDTFSSLKSLGAIFKSSSAQDISVQLKSESVSSSKEIRILVLSGATPTDPASGTSMLVKIDLKNTSVL